MVPRNGTVSPSFQPKRSASFLPTMARERAAELMAGWERAVRQAVAP